MATHTSGTSAGPESEERRGERPYGRPALRAVVVSAAVLLAGSAMLWLLLPPPLFTDSFHVFQAAAAWPDIPPGSGPGHQLTRIGLLLPAWAAHAIAGHSQVAYYATSAALTGLCPVGCLLAGRALFGERAGLVAAAALLLHPFFTVVDPYVRSVNASTGGILPDAPAAGLFALGTAAVVLAARRAGRRRTVLLIAAGTAFGAAFLCREFVVLMYAAVPAFFVLLGIPVRRIGLVAGPIAAAALLSLGHNAWVFGDALAALHASEDVMRGGPATTRIEALGCFFAAMLTRHWLGAVFLAGLAATVAGWAVTRDRRLALTLVWFLALWVPLTLLSGVLNPDDPAFDWALEPRYWTPVFPPLLIGGLGASVLLWRRASGWLIGRTSGRASGRGSEGVSGGRSGVAVPRAALASALVGTLAVAYLVPASRALGGVRRDRAWNQLRGWLAARPDIPVLWTDAYSAQTLTFYTRSPWGRPLWRGRIATYRARRHQVPAAVGHAPVLQTRQGVRTRPTTVTGWRRIWRSADGGSLSVWVRAGAAAHGRSPQGGGPGGGPGGSPAGSRAGVP